MDGILSDQAIRAAVESGDIEIDPFSEKQLNITSYDLTLGDEVRVYKQWVDGSARNLNIGPGEERWFTSRDHISDSKQELETVAYKINPEKGWVLCPGVGYLMHTKERVKTNRFNPILDGKSSIGRLFIQVHFTAGYGDPGFNGQYTLEVQALHPIRVYPGMRFCQIRFHTIAGELSKTYDQVGHYTRETASGAVASQAWRQFER